MFMEDNFFASEFGSMRKGSSEKRKGEKVRKKVTTITKTVNGKTVVVRKTVLYNEKGEKEETKTEEIEGNKNYINEY